MVHVNGNITIVTNGTAAGSLKFTLPINAAANNVSFGGRESQVTGIVFGGASIAVGTIAITKYDATYLGGDGYVFPINFSYRKT